MKNEDSVGESHSGSMDIKLPGALSGPVLHFSLGITRILLNNTCYCSVQTVNGVKSVEKKEFHLS